MYGIFTVPTDDLVAWVEGAWWLGAKPNSGNQVEPSFQVGRFQQWDAPSCLESPRNKPGISGLICFGVMLGETLALPPDTWSAPPTWARHVSTQEVAHLVAVSQTIMKPLDKKRDSNCAHMRHNRVLQELVNQAQPTLLGANILPAARVKYLCSSRCKQPSMIWTWQGTDLADSLGTKCSVASGLIIVTVSGTYQSQKLGCFPFNRPLRELTLMR